MATGFSRSVSLPNSNPPSCSGRSGKFFHVRSTSLPCRSHPLVSQIEDELRACRIWRWSTEPQSAAGLCAGMIRLELLHLALGDLLQLPQTRDALRRSTGGPSSLSESLLEDFLMFADAYGSFRSALVSLQELQLAAQVAVRRRDKACLASVARSLRKAEKEIASLSSTLSKVSKSADLALAAAWSGSSAEDAELAGIFTEVKAVTVSVSTAVFQATAASLASTMTSVASKSSASWTALKRRLALTSSSMKRMNSSEGTDKEEAWARTASEKLDGLEEGIIGLESGSERVFRALMNTRVSLLNIMTP
ncbi:hypothetical protein Taro_033988 [Colocasia esculenta]|uniref:Uncharacterized protein n=1 Tax=Colocasia esculenta TaxID=4460 RepID=A0A843W2W4_COLES|nr:hypothetical protein [Colocasia esculenta]